MAFSPAHFFQSVWTLNAHSNVERAWLSPPVVSHTLSASRRLSSPFLISAQYNSRRLNGDFVSSTVRSPVSTKVTNGGEKTEDHPMDTVDDNKSLSRVFEICGECLMKASDLGVGAFGNLSLKSVPQARGDFLGPSVEIADGPLKLQERDFAGTPYVPVYVMLPLSVININCELVDPDGLVHQLRILKSINVDGVMVDCWWGIVEAHTPQVYNWSGYKRLFQIVHDIQLKLQGLLVIFVVCCLAKTRKRRLKPKGAEAAAGDFLAMDMVRIEYISLYIDECSLKELKKKKGKLEIKTHPQPSVYHPAGNVGDDVHIPLPEWVREIGRSNPDIFFTDKEGRRNPECLSWGIDKERVLKGRTAVEVYFDYMRSFRVEFDEFFANGIISEIEIGLGPCGELRYPSYPANHGWKYPGIGEFQCYDQYLSKSLTKAAEARGHLFWAKGPDNAGHYNSRPHETVFFCDGGEYDSYYGRFFLNWYSRVLVDHGDRVLALANLAFEGTCIAVKLSGIHWWYKTASHASELTAGFYNPCNRDGYAPISEMLQKHGAALNFTCVELRTLDQEEGFPEALADPEGLVWQVLNAAWDVSIPVASENALTCHDREGYNKILENAKPFNDPDGRHLSAFTYLRLSPVLMETHNFTEFERFVKRMHGEAVPDLACVTQPTT
ncbi:Beta-amylase 2, chloroplastic [Vitis vinifera]|uniref:Beta-amylase n=1 Tax=Vitis vinifera TaxID=29760 RepID=A0A438JLZ7_VITVI|nr:Beta-amylase 2, chloroplastic [Vitis vinifera]